MRRRLRRGCRRPVAGPGAAAGPRGARRPSPIAGRSGRTVNRAMAPASRSRWTPRSSRYLTRRARRRPPGRRDAVPAPWPQRRASGPGPRRARVRRGRPPDRRLAARADGPAGAGRGGRRLSPGRRPGRRRPSVAERQPIAGPSPMMPSSGASSLPDAGWRRRPGTPAAPWPSCPCPRRRAGRSSTRASSPVAAWPSSIRTCARRSSSATRSSTSATRRTPIRSGGWRSRSAPSPTTARSTPCAGIASRSAVARATVGGRPIAAELTAAGPLLSPDGSDSLSLDEGLELLTTTGWGLTSGVARGDPGGARPPTRPASARRHAASPDRRDAGAVGRAGGDRVRRREAGRRAHRPQRPASGGLRREPRPARGRGVGGGGRAVRRRRDDPSRPTRTRASCCSWSPAGGRSSRTPTRRPGSCATCRSTTSRERSTRTPPDAAARAVERRPPLDHAARYLAGLDAERARLDIKTMALEAHEPLWSMGDDTPTAGRGRLDRPIADHLRQAFAQVTNPAIDPERERVVMDLRVELGRRPALLGGPPRGPRTLRLERPIVADLPGLLAALAATAAAASARSTRPGRPRRAPPGWPRPSAALADAARARRGVGRGGPARQRRRDVGRPAAGAVDPGRGRGPHRADRCRPARPHGHRRGRRRHPRRAFDGDGPRGRRHGRPSAARPRAGGRARGHARRRGRSPAAAAIGNLVAAFEAGLRKTLARMGISAVASYIGGTLIDTVDLAPDVIARCFPNAAAWPGRTTLADLGERALCVVERRPSPCHRRPPAASRACRTRAGRASAPMARRTCSRRASPRRSRSCPDRSTARPPSASVDAALARYRTALGRGADAPAVPRDELRVRRSSRPARARRGRGRARDRPPLRRVGDERGRPEPGGAPGTDDRDPARRRRREHRRGRRGPGLVRAGTGRPPPRRAHQAGRLGAVRRDRDVPGPRRPARDQDLAGLQARRGRPAARAQGDGLYRGPPARPGRPELHQPAAPPRHLLDRGPRPAHRRPARDQPDRADRGQARGQPGRRHGRRGRRQGRRDVHPPLGPRRRDRGVAAQLDQARRRAVGAGPRRGPPGPAAQRPARPGRAAHGRRPADRSRPARRGPAGRRGVRVRDGGARGGRLRHGPPVPPRHVPDRHRHPARGPAGQVHRHARDGRAVLPRRRRGPAAGAGGGRCPVRRRGHRREPAAAAAGGGGPGRARPGRSGRRRGARTPRAAPIPGSRRGSRATRRRHRSRLASRPRSATRARSRSAACG